MGLSIYTSESRNTGMSFEISYDLIEQLESAFDNYGERHGSPIDYYGTTKIYSESIPSLLSDCLRELAKAPIYSLQASETLDFCVFLSDCLVDKIPILYIEGD